MMFWFQLAVVVVLLIAVGWVAVGGGGHMSQPVPDRPDPAVPGDGLLGRGDVDKVRFSVGARGYRMDEVDDVLDRLAHEIDLRERRIAQLEGRPLPEEPEESEEAPAPAAFGQLPPMPPQQAAQGAQEARQAQAAAPAGGVSSLTEQEPSAPQGAEPQDDGDAEGPEGSEGSEEA